MTLPSGLLSTDRTASYFALVFSDSVTFLPASETSSNKKVQLDKSYNVEFSILDNVVLIQAKDAKSNPRFFNI